MNLRGVLFLLGRLLLALTVTLLVPATFAFRLGEPVLPFLVPATVALAAGLVLQIRFRHPTDHKLDRNGAFLLITAAWATASLVGALPYVLVHGPGFAVDALFEAASGFTTTGASVIPHPESLPASLLLWRSLTQWLGGVGVIVLGIAVLPKLAVGGMELLGEEAAPFRVEEKLRPRIAQIARSLGSIYAGLTLLLALILVLVGMTPLDAVHHSMTTMATGGFSTRAGGIGSFANPAVEWVLVAFMLIAGTNFALHFHLLRGRLRPVARDSEFRFYLVLWLGAASLVALDLWLHGGPSNAADALRSGAFQVASVLSTAGHTSAGLASWPGFSLALLFLLMFIGACTSSTGGSVKVVRVLIVVRKLAADLKRLAQPHAVVPVRVGGRPVADEIVSSVVTFFTLFLVLCGLGGLTLAMLGLDLVAAFSASASCIGNVGLTIDLPGGYVMLPVAAKLVLVTLMIVGRLELYPVLVLMLGRRR